ncbi:MAG: hypothetical protein K8T26_06835 [Lentisphaerae bacterium]|nr:hypothetical protein [Lentisphaerota bacterium]
MTRPLSSRLAFHGTCLGLLVAAMLLTLGQWFYNGSASASAGALDVLVDELVELHRQALTGAGDGTAVYRAWHDLRNQFGVRSVQARTRGGPLLVRVRIDSNPQLVARPPACLYYVLTPREDDAWEIAPLDSWWTFWLR